MILEIRRTPTWDCPVFPLPLPLKRLITSGFLCPVFPDFPLSERGTILCAPSSHPNPVTHFSGLMRWHFVQARGMEEGWEWSEYLWVTAHAWVPATSSNVWSELKRPRTLFFPWGIVRHFGKCRPGQETPVISFYPWTHIWPAMLFSFWSFLCF